MARVKSDKFRRRNNLSRAKLRCPFFIIQFPVPHSEATRRIEEGLECLGVRFEGVPRRTRSLFSRRQTRDRDSAAKQNLRGNGGDPLPTPPRGIYGKLMSLRIEVMDTRESRVESRWTNIWNIFIYIYIYSANHSGSIDRSLKIPRLFRNVFRISFHPLKNFLKKIYFLVPFVI